MRPPRSTVRVLSLQLHPIVGISIPKLFASWGTHTHPHMNRAPALFTRSRWSPPVRYGGH